MIPAGAYQTSVIYKVQERTTHNQYLCRATGPDGITVPGKANGAPANGPMFEWGCYGAYLVGAEWREFGADQVGARFEVFVPASQCRYDWVHLTPGMPLPANALRTAQEPGGAPLYTCRISTNDEKTTGAHVGRVGGAAGAICVVQYFGTVYSRDTYDVLVQL